MSRDLSNPRRAAFLVLRDVAAGAYADRAATERFSGLDARDRRLAQELAYGAIRLRGRLDAELSHWSSRPIDKLDRDVREALRLGLYQLRETRIPAHAAVASTLDAVAPELRRPARGVVNAILRRAAREGRPPDLFPALEDDPLLHLSSWGSHPEWLVRRWLQRASPKDVARLVELDNSPPPVTFRLLPLSDTRAAGFDPAAYGLELLEDRPGMARLAEGSPAEGIRAGVAIAQDPAASSVVDYLKKYVAEPFLDACAAPGGKSVALWAETGADPFISGDVSLGRLRNLRRLAADAGADLLPVVMDARRPAVREVRSLLLDVPCSGTGVLRRRPDARWRLTPSRLSDLVALQADLLEAASQVVVPGGVLFYATCSIEPEENEGQVERFLSRHPEFDREGGDLRIRPWDGDTDGAFASRLRKRRST